MNANRILSALIAPVMLAGSALPATASPPRVEVPELPAPFVNASSECLRQGQQIATREGGELYNVSAETRGGQQVCVIVVVVRQPGEHPRRREFIVPR